MSELKISPTPWVVDRYLVRDAGGNTIADLEDLIDLHEMPREQVNLHAHLIAAAPDLLVALKGMTTAIANAKSEAFERANGNHWEADNHARALEEKLNAAYTAIAKAEGA